MTQPQIEADLPACGCSCGPCQGCERPVTPGMRLARQQRAKLFAMLRDGDTPAPAQPDITPQTGQPEHIEVGSYRTDAGHTAWAMRCWGDGTCDGLVSLDHDTERWALVARDRHLAEAHNVTTPQAGQPQADGPLVLDRAVAVAMRDCLNQLLGDEPAVGAPRAALHTHGGADAAPGNGAAVRRRMLRARYAADVERAIGLNAVFGAVVGVHRVRDAVLAVRDDEVARLRAELTEAIDGWNEEANRRSAGDDPSRRDAT